MADSLYSSLELGRRQIRLVRLLPTDQDTGLTSCTLTVAPLDNDTHFDALSYCWGAPNVTTTILVNKLGVEVTQNLADALRHFQIRGVASNIPIWIDAICINQRNIPERNSQVTMMDDIYQRAATVHVWLGGPQIVSETGMAALRELIDHIHSVRPLGARWPKHEDIAADAKLRDLGSLASNPYWKRTWIVQEISFAANVVVHGNEQQVALGGGIQFSKMHSSIVHRQSNEKLPEISIMIAAAFYPMTIANWSASIARAGAIGEAAFARIPQELFLHLRHSLASDPRDKIYGMLSLVPGVFEITPDYSKTMAEVYRDATLQLTNGSKDLEVLLQACSGSSELPSWVPDFRVPSRMPAYHYKTLMCRRAGVLSQTVSEVTDEGHLLVKAFELDRIAHIERCCGNATLDGNENLSELKVHLTRWRTLFDQYAEPRSEEVDDTTDRDYVFWRAVCAGANDVDQMWFDAGDVVKCRTLVEHLDSLLAPSSEDQRLVSYLSSIIKDNDFFVTYGGHAGLVAMNSIEPDDTILVLASSPAPFCARQVPFTNGERYTLKAPCFVDNRFTNPGEWVGGERVRRNVMDGGVVLAKANCGIDDEEAIDKIFREIFIA